MSHHEWVVFDKCCSLDDLFDDWKIALDSDDRGGWCGTATGPGGYTLTSNGDKANQAESRLLAEMVACYRAALLAMVGPEPDTTRSGDYPRIGPSLMHPDSLASATVFDASDVTEPPWPLPPREQDSIR